jgi:thiol:disulfide interchange protein DsbD
VCSEVDGKCIPNVEDFSFSSSKAVVQATDIDSLGEQAFKEENTTAMSQVDKAPKVAAGGNSETAEKVEESSLKENTVGAASNDAYSLGSFMLVAFLSGLVALLTPCVFPMVPMTVTFFTSRSHNRAQAISKAALYGVSIIVLYILIGTVVSLINGPAFANFLSTHWLPNVFFFATFVFFALSFLGMFDLTLPIAHYQSGCTSRQRGLCRYILYGLYHCAGIFLLYGTYCRQYPD